MTLNKISFFFFLAFMISGTLVPAQNQDDRIVFHYLKLSAALSRSDLKQASRHTEKLAGQVLTSAHSGLFSSAEAMKKASDINQIRQAFSPFSDTLAVLVRTRKIIAAESLYLVHCPMAFQDQGADWIADEPKVINPYFGDEMLHCGKVKATLFKAGK
jgi:hypothetical protein